MVLVSEITPTYTNHKGKIKVNGWIPKENKTRNRGEAGPYNLNSRQVWLQIWLAISVFNTFWVCNYFQRKFKIYTNVLRAHTALSEDPSSVPSTHVRWLKAPVTTAPRRI